MSSPIPESSAAASYGVRPRKLGRGLASLMANTRLAPPQAPAIVEAPSSSATNAIARHGSQIRTDSQTGRPIQLSIEAIQPNPYQPRRSFDAAQIAELAESIRHEGLLQPLLVSPKADDTSSYILIAGERRLRASKQAGLTEVACFIREANNEQLLQWALLENIQRSDLNAVDRAVAYRDFMDRFGLSQQDLAERMAEPRSTIANYLRILDLCDYAQSLVVGGQLTFGHAKVLASLAGQEDKQRALSKKVIDEDLSVRQLEQLVKSTQGQMSGNDPTPASYHKSQHIQSLERQLSQTIGTRVTIQPGKRKHFGKVIVEYYSLDDFDRITASLGAKLES